MAAFLALVFIAWRRYLWASQAVRPADTCPFSLGEVFGDDHLINVPHQNGVEWLTDVFSRSAKKFPQHPALQIPHSGETLTFAELDSRANDIATALGNFLTGPDQVVAISMAQDNWQIVASHLAVLKAGGTLMFLDSTQPESLLAHMLDDAEPVVVLTRGLDQFQNLPTLDVLTVPEASTSVRPPDWLDDPGARLAAIFYTSGTTGLPKGVECPHAGYVNLALGYADYFDLVPGMDATSLTSSLGYDGSISEMYSAWVSGCAVVLLTKDEIRSGPDLVPLLCEAEVTVLFCPPVLLTSLTSSPELDLPYPICRYIVPAGEAFPATLVEPWTRGRRQIINTYGPTEASTDTSRQSLRPDEAVTIGSPMANVTYVILEVDGIKPLPHGEVGELCIGGVHVARGYRNLREETEAKFIEHPEFGRLYRTGDRCQIDMQTQRVHFLGRVDLQLKVRGHRVEVQAVEDILQTQFSEIEAAVLDYQNDELIAFVVAPLAPTDFAGHVIEKLRSLLPEPAVPSRVLLVDGFTLKPMSGKIDREQLPRLSESPTASAPPRVERSFEETAAVLSICQDVFETSLGADDSFADSGGHSIAIARLAQRLQAAGWRVPVRDLLGSFDTARKIAARPRVAKSENTAPTKVTSSSNPNIRDEKAAKALSVGVFTILQLLFLVLLFAPVTVSFLMAVANLEIGEFFIVAGLREVVEVGALVYFVALLLPFASLLWVLIIKLGMGGHPYKSQVTPGSYPKWSRMHLRIWCIERMEHTVLIPAGVLLRSAPLTAFFLRQLGATVGKNLQCAQNVDFSGPLSLLSIDNDVCIQSGAYVHLSKWSGQELHIGPIHLESRCKIGMRAALACDVTIGSGAWVHPFAPILSDIGPNEMWEGAPARCTGRRTELRRPEMANTAFLPVRVAESLNILLQIALDLLLAIVPALAVAWVLRNIFFASAPVTAISDFLWRLALFTLTTSLVALSVSSVLVCLFIRLTRTTPGLYRTGSLRAALLLYRVQKMNQLQSLWTWTITGQYLRALAGVRFNRLGASECDLMWNLVPETVSADASVFWSNGSYTNMLDHDAKHMTLRQLDMPVNFFAGNNCVAQAGHLPTNFLLGVSTPADDVLFRRQMNTRPGTPTTVVGNPPIEFASADFEAENRLQKPPTFLLFLTRVLLNDVAMVALFPIARVTVFALSYIVLLQLGGNVLTNAFFALFLAEIVLVSASVLIKKLLVGKWGSAHSTPFWSVRHFTYFFAQDCFFAWCKVPISFLEGTLLPNALLRRMGCRIGKRTLLKDPMQASDWNAVQFGDDCVVASFLQYHTFENMTLKVKRTDIRDGTAANFGATVMGGAVIEPGSTLLPLSLVLKEIHLAPDVYEGSPAEAVNNAN